MSVAPTVAELFSDPLLRGVELVAGVDGLERIVEDVHLYDSGIENQSHALIVCGEPDVTPAFRLDALVRRAEAAGAAAVLVLAKHSRPLLSGVRLADRLRIPVLWLERDDRFRFALEIAVHLRAPLVERAETLLRVVREIGAKPDAESMLAQLSTTLGLRVSFLSPEGRAIFGAQIGIDELRFDLAVPHRSLAAIVHPVLIDGRPAAWLACEAPGIGESAKERVVAALAVTEPYVRAWLISENARADRDSAFLARLLSEIIAVGADVSRDTAERAVAVGWRLDEWHTGVHLVCDDPRAPSDSDLLIGQFRGALAEADIALNGIADHSGGWAMWVNAVVQPSAQDTRLLVRGLRHATSRLPKEWGLVAGVGRAHHGAAGLADSITEARNAGHLARSRDFRPSVETLDELGVAQLLATLQQSEVTRAFAETALAPISGTANEHLLATLATYLQNGGSVLFTAQSLQVHRNTVTARLQQLQERLGVDLNDPSQLLALQIAVRAIRA